MYRLHGVVAAGGLIAAAAALAVTLRTTTLRLPSVGSLMAVCGDWLHPYANPAQLVVLGLGGLSLAVLWRGIGSGLQAHRSARCFLRQLPLVGELPGLPHARLVEDQVPLAFCAGLARPRIYLSTGAAELLDEDELRAVLAHEAHHAARRDPLRLLVAAVLGDALFFLPVMRRLRQRYAAFAELAADEAAVVITGAKQPLASAMLRFGELHSTVMVGVTPERVDYLHGESPRWQLPRLLLLVAVITLAVLAALVLATAQATRPSQLNAPGLLMRSCGPVMLLIAWLVAARLMRFARAR